MKLKKVCLLRGFDLMFSVALWNVSAENNLHPLCAAVWFLWGSPGEVQCSYCSPPSSGLNVKKRPKVKRPHKRFLFSLTMRTFICPLASCSDSDAAVEINRPEKRCCSWASIDFCWFCPSFCNAAPAALRLSGGGGTFSPLQEHRWSPPACSLSAAVWGGGGRRRPLISFGGLHRAADTLIQTIQSPTMPVKSGAAAFLVILF